jgi:hypothetical protein
MSLHQFIQLTDGDTFGMLTHQTEDRFDGTVLLGEFSAVRHDCSFLPPFFSRYLGRGDTWPGARCREVIVANKWVGQPSLTDSSNLHPKQPINLPI